MFLLLFVFRFQFVKTCHRLQKDKGHRQSNKGQVPLLAHQRHLVKRLRTSRRHNRVGHRAADAGIGRRRRGGRADGLGRGEQGGVAVGAVLVAVLLDDDGRGGHGRQSSSGCR